jgi:Ubiquinol-cytochrome C reductase hinge protein
MQRQQHNSITTLVGRPRRRRRRMSFCHGTKSKTATLTSKCTHADFFFSSLNALLLLFSFWGICFLHLPPLSLPAAHHTPLQTEQPAEVADKTQEIREKCKSACPNQLNLYKACQHRIAASGAGDCEPWYIELITCADKCMAPQVFAITKGG